MGRQVSQRSTAPVTTRQTKAKKQKSKLPTREESHQSERTEKENTSPAIKTPEALTSQNVHAKDPGPPSQISQISAVSGSAKRKQTETEFQPETKKVKPMPWFELIRVEPLDSLETPLHQKKPKTSFVERGSLSPVSLPSPGLGRRLGEEETDFIINYGSEPESSDDSEDEDELAPQFVPRTIRALMDMPWQPEDTADDHPATSDHPVDPASPTATVRPRSLYDFEWKDFPAVPIPCESRRETFSQNNVGPTAPSVDPYELFMSIWDRQFMEHIVSETNKYAQEVASHMLEAGRLHPHSRIGSWVDTNVDEIYCFLGLVLGMGVLVKSRVAEYWHTASDIFTTPGFSVYMSRNRFLLLSRCLHFSSNRDMESLNLGHTKAKLFKIQPVLNHLNNKFQSLYVLHQNIALDESLLMWKGLLEINQLVPNKTATVGIKTYEVCESQTGYLWRFEVHAHDMSSPAQQEDPLNATTPATVLRLLHGLENKGYTVWMDSFYNSPALARRLKTLGFDCVGTLRTNFKLVPQALHSLTNDNMQPGQLTGLTSGDVDVLVWRDNNRVALLSTYHGKAVSTNRGSTKPIVVLDYNIMMGGVDKKDQMLSMYPIERKRTKVWYKKFFSRLLNVSVLNAYIIYTKSFTPPSRPMSHRNFRISLIRSLVTRHSAAVPHPLPRPTTQTVDMTHRLEFLPYNPLNTARQRRLCQNAECRKRTTTFCVGCDEACCIGSCFLIVHTS